MWKIISKQKVVNAVQGYKNKTKQNMRFLKKKFNSAIMNFLVILESNT